MKLKVKMKHAVPTDAYYSNGIRHGMMMLKLLTVANKQPT